MSSPHSNRTLQHLPAEVGLSIVSHLDDISNIAFALTSRTNFHLVTAYKGSLSSLQPPFWGYSHIDRNGDRPHEVFARLLWSWLGERCAYCGMHEVLAQDWDKRIRKWTYTRHLCRGWLTQYEGLYTYEHQKTSFEFKEKLVSQSIILKRFYHLRCEPVDAEWCARMWLWMKIRGMTT